MRALVRFATVGKAVTAANLQIGKGDNTWDQKDTQIDFKGAATLKGDKFGYAYDKDGNEIPGPKNELRGVDVEIKLKYGCKELEIYDNQCTYGPWPFM
jgi:hypothetical protein